MLSVTVSPANSLSTDMLDKPSHSKLPCCNYTLNSKSILSVKTHLIAKVKGVGEAMINGLNVVIEPIKRGLSFKQLGEIALVPFHVVSIAKICIGFPRYNKEKKIDAGLNICSGLREIADSTATFIVKLEDIHAIPTSPVAWTTPFAIVMSVLSIVSVVVNVRTCMKVKRLMKEFNLAETSGKVDGKITKASYQAMLKVIKSKQNEDEDFISDVFNTTKEKLACALVRLESSFTEKLQSKDLQVVEEGQKILEKSVKSLKGRVKHNLTSSILNIISSTVNIIGTAIFLAFPVSPLGWAIIAVSALIDAGRWINHKVVEYQFAKVVELKRTKWEWVTC